MPGHGAHEVSGSMSVTAMTPMQRQICDMLQNDCDEWQKGQLDFILEMHAGIHLMQLRPHSCCQIHAQLMDDLKTLKLDQGTGYNRVPSLSSIKVAERRVD